MKARFWLILIIVLVLTTGIALAVWRPWSNTAEYELYTVSPGEVVSTVSVAGSVVNGHSLSLSFPVPGVVRTVAVRVGSEVKKGDLLVALNTDVLNRQAAQARAGITAAQAMLNKARNQLRPVDVNVVNLGLESARVAWENAKRSYDNALSAYNASQGAIGSSADLARVALNNAQTALNNAQSNYQQVANAYGSGRATLMEMQQAAAALNGASAAYDTASVQYQIALRGSDVDRSTSRIQLDSARAALNSAEAAYRLAEAQRSQSLAPAGGADIQSASAQVAANTAALQIVQAQINQSILRAPISGKVVALNAKVAELAPTGQPVVVLETPDDFKIEANISEVELSKVKPGQVVRIALDALPGVIASGRIATIDPSATIVLGVVSYKATVLLDQPITGLMSALTADLEIVTDQRSEVLMVPRRALDKIDGQYRVKILIDGKPVERTVEVGLLGDGEAEIVSGLNGGEQIILKEL